MNQPARVEFIVEPFVLGEPGPHVAAAVQVAKDVGLSPDMGPFATTAAGDLHQVIASIGEMLQASFANGASSVQFRVDTEPQSTALGLHGALERMVADVEREIGMAISDMGREEKQRAVARLDTYGAFLLRGSVEQVADLMQVSKVTLYAYINAVAGTNDQQPDA